ncbi:hypothetical protein DPEC_G00042440 [Dallia pectoralis]|uniref:Uncharacterized protein n=1 Tax=Dallia pectoralis TaxID=75939 RepID=A0ACC2H901_DALPE|nr:hypothetical protein DPEC_G00042440 [Dallia pectoralis]
MISKYQYADLYLQRQILAPNLCCQSLLLPWSSCHYHISTSRTRICPLRSGLLCLSTSINCHHRLSTSMNSCHLKLLVPRSSSHRPPGAQEQQPSPPGAQEQQPSPPGAQEQQSSPPGAQEQQPSPPGAQEQQPSPPGAQEQQPSPPGAQEQQLHRLL